MDGGRSGQADGAGARERRQPDGIVLDDWSSGADAEYAPVRKTSLFGARSPLARRIVAINLVALGALVVGVLYLSQFDEALVTERELGLLAETRVIAQAVAMDAPADFGTSQTRERSTEAAQRYVARLGLSSPNRIRVYDRAGRMLADSQTVPNAGTVRLVLP
jgi:two-component system, OmpR family, sensor histidine kinase ChvG